MRGVGRITAAVGAAVAGAGAAVFFLLPRHGARRRQSAANVAKRQTAHVATIVGARSNGRDVQLVETVRQELAGRFGDEAAELGITAHRGVVTLRGEVTRLQDIDTFEEAARSVSGVGDVNNLLRLVSRSRATL